MKITVIGPAYPLRGGIAHHVYCLQQVLSRRGHTLQVISFRKLYPSMFFPGKTELDASSRAFDAGAERILDPLNPITWLRAMRTIKNFAPAAIIFQWWQPFFGPMVGSLIRLFQRQRFRCIVECHNVFSHEGTPFDRLLARFALRTGDGFITHSQTDEADLRQVVRGKRISVVSLPTPSEFLSRREPARDGRTILFFGKVRKYKGLEVLLRAMPKVLGQVECQLKIVGEFYDSIEKYLDLIRELNLEKSVHIDDRYVPNEEVSGIFESADVLVLPYLSATQSAVAQIALRNGLPLIASRTGGLAEVIDENVNGLLCFPGDADSLASQIVAYFNQNLGPVFAKNITSKSTPVEELSKVVEALINGQETVARWETEARHLA
jgi:glycosyltransferase involved in cell wall biosynthesis